MKRTASKVSTVLVALIMVGVSQWAFPRVAAAELTDDQWAAREARLDYWADAILGPLDSIDVASLGWYVEIRYEVESNYLRLYSAAGTGSHVSQSVRDGAAAEGITIEEFNKGKPLQQLLVEQRDLSDQMERDGVVTGANVIDINPTSANQAMTVTTNSASIAEGEVAGADNDADAAEIYGDYLSDILDTKVDVVVDDSREPEPASRQNDSSPWYGGAGLLSPTSRFCSSGFGARRTVGSTTYNYLITAWHCGGGTYKDRASEVIGSASTASSATRAADVTAIQVSSGSAGNKVYDGAWNNTVNYSKYVGSRGTARFGKKYCTSGAMSGIHCGSRVYKTNSRVKYNTGQIVFGLVKAEQISGGVAVAQGDSGGPVIGPHAGAWSKVQAIGIISGGDVSVPCGATALNTTCLKIVFFQPIKAALDIYGATLNYG